MMMRNSLFFLLSLALAAISMVTVDAITGKVVSCPAWTLNSHKELRLFLKGGTVKKGEPPQKGEIEEYSGISIEWKRGKHAILTIYDDEGKELEEIKLYDLDVREEMHQLLLDKGFAKKTQANRIEEIKMDMVQKQLRAMDSSSAVAENFTHFYFLIAVLVVVGVLHRKKKGKKEKKENEEKKEKKEKNKVHRGSATLSSRV